MGMAGGRRTARWAIALLGCVALTVAACGGGSAPALGPDPLAGAQPQQRLSLAARDVAFDQRELAGTAGEVIEIAIVNRGTLPHDFTIDELLGEIGNTGRERPDDHAVHVTLQRNKERLLLLRVSAPGRYPFYCSVPGHRKSGMEGMLVIQ
ncbi:MAG: hypothetical protein EXR65_00825 [Dehalococcoidia bacterium]|nr:hypothetical protein [Dehalococcoidia bacterium]